MVLIVCGPVFSDPRKLFAVLDPAFRECGSKSRCRYRYRYVTTMLLEIVPTQQPVKIQSVDKMLVDIKSASRNLYWLLG
jgi:hypothetical protein